MTEDEKSRPCQGGSEPLHLDSTGIAGGSAVLDAALRYASSGIAVFPVRLYIRGDGRKGVSPIGNWDGVSSTDPDTIRAWFTGTWADAALAIDCGKSGIVGVDQDVSDGKSGPQNWDALNPSATWRVRSPSGGYHDYYRADPAHPFTVDNSGAVADGVDIRGMGGFLFAPPSIDPRGGAWQWVEGEPDWSALPMVPEIVIKRMEQAAARKRGAVPAPIGAPMAQPSSLFPSGAGLKSETAANRDMRALLEKFSDPKADGRASGGLAGLAMLAGRGVAAGFWSEGLARKDITDRAYANGYVQKHGLADLETQLSRGLRDGMADPWTVVPDAAPEAAEVEPSSWERIDISHVLAGERIRVVPTLGRRQDGQRIIYAGKEHSVSSEPECGKTWWVLLQVLDILTEGGRVVYLDFEDDENTIVGRLMDLGCPASLLGQDTFRYARPEGPPPTGVITKECTFGEHHADLLVLDGVTEGMGACGLDPLSQKDIVQWRKVAKEAMRLGTAVLSTDHETKSKETRGRFAIGGQHKLAGLNGVMFKMQSVTPFSEAKGGRSRVFISKDRNGGLRNIVLPSDQDGLENLGDLVCKDGLWTFYAPKDSEKADDASGYPIEHRAIVKAALTYLAGSGEPRKQDLIVAAVGKKRAAVIAALNWMEVEGMVQIVTGQRNAKLHSLTFKGASEAAKWKRPGDEEQG